LMLAALRRVIENDASVRRGDWQRAGASTPWGLHGRCVGIVGLGHIGSAVARRLHGFECDVIAFDPYVEERPRVTLVTPDRLFELPNVVLSPHIAGLTADSVRELTVQAVTSALDVLAGRPNPGIVNPEALVHPRQRRQ